MAYGDKRDYPKIDIFLDGKYEGTTTWSRTCADAKEKYLVNMIKEKYDPDRVTCHFQKTD